MNENAAATVMVVDDTPANLRLLENLLRGQGYRVLAFPRGELALNAAHRNPPDLVLLDVTMPGMDGYEVCTRLKASETTREIPVLFISALSDTADKVKGFAAGGVDYVTKPFEFGEVLARVETHLALKRYRAEILSKNRELDESFHRLKELEALRDALVHMVVHDLRSPLSAVLGYLDLMDEEIGQGLAEAHHELLDRARSAARDLAQRINTVLDVNRLEEGAMPLNLARVDLREIAERAIGSLGPQTEGLALSLRPDAGAVEATCDPDLVERVLVNLLHNAAKFAPRPSDLEIALEAEGDRVRVSVRDQGPGVPPEFRESIFEKFKQVGDRREAQRRGTGLGLAFCRLAVEAHGGSIGVDCPPDGGSLFWFRLPVAPP